MANAKKTKSGKWRVLVFDYTDSDGKRHYKSFTAATKKAAERKAADFLLNGSKGERTFEDILFGQAVDRYISTRPESTSPATIKGYKQIKRCYLGTLENYKLSAVSTNVVQILINELSARLSPKTVRNIHSLIQSVVSTYAPHITLKTRLPKKEDPEFIVPVSNEVQRLIDVAPPKAKVPFMLAAYGSLRRSEISALTPDDVCDTGVKVTKAAVYDENGNIVVKRPKTKAGNRFVPLPQFVIQACREWSGYGLPPATISTMFCRARDKAGLPHFTFHKLRHHFASACHAEGIPDKYICEVGGWESADVLRNVYQHTLRDKQTEMQSKIVSIFDRPSQPSDEKTHQKQA